MTIQHYTKTKGPKTGDRVHITGGSKYGFNGTILRPDNGWWVALDEWPGEEFKLYSVHIARIIHSEYSQP